MNISELSEMIEPVLHILATCGIIIEFTPIKINPLSYILKRIGNIMNSDINVQIRRLNDELVEHEIDQLRWNILEFSNSCMQGKNHTKEEFDHVISDHQKYEQILKREGKTNGQVDIAFNAILDIYAKCIRDNSFL